MEEKPGNTKKGKQQGKLTLPDDETCYKASMFFLKKTNKYQIDTWTDRPME